MLNGITGLIEANNARIRGHIEALSGLFRGRIEADSGYFGGSISSGPLVASNEVINPTGHTWPAGTLTSTIRLNLGIGLTEERVVNVSGGSFGIQTGLTRIEFAMGFTAQSPGARVGIMRLFLSSLSPASNPIVINNSVGNNPVPISAALAASGVNLSLQGQTLRFLDLPAAGGGLPAGTVWRDAQGFLRVV